MMIFTRKLISLLLLGVFPVFLMHQALSHVHHTHDEISGPREQVKQHLHASGENFHHYHSKNAHHHQNSDTGQVKGHHHGLLGLILGIHSHSDGANHVPVVNTPTPQNFKVKNFGEPLLAFTDFSCSLAEIGSSQVSFHSADIQYNQYQPFFNLRGPPNNI